MTLSHCKISCEATLIKINVVKQKDRKMSQWNRRKSPEIDPYGHLNWQRHCDGLLYGSTWQGCGAQLLSQTLVYMLL